MDLKRTPLITGTNAGDEFKIRQNEAQRMLRGDMDQQELEKYVESRVLTTTLDKALTWARSNAIFPATFGLACCAIEMITLVGSRLDIARIGSEAMRASPRQADLLILSGRVSIKMAPIIRRIYDQMLEPKWTIAMGACSSSMGVFNNYAIVPADKFLPVDVHVPGCPPRPEAVMYGILKLRDQIQNKPDLGWRARYEAGETVEVLGTEGVPNGGGSITTTRNTPPVSSPAVQERILAEAARRAAPGLTLPPLAIPTAHGNDRA
ncbi:MAG: NADH-quinone oxidoreductase subunit B family protein [Solirubrobacteraceae bacterium]|nr:NADH-quinone oxidoreductase subunit B family protein [Solirubrobacteraceae bacterium]